MFGPRPRPLWVLGIADENSILVFAEDAGDFLRIRRLDECGLQKDARLLRREASGRGAALLETVLRQNAVARRHAVREHDGRPLVRTSRNDFLRGGSLANLRNDFCTTDHSRLFVITETKNTTWRIRSLPSESAGPSRRPEAWKAFRGAPQILISRALETRSSKKGPPEPGGPFSSEEPAHQPKRI